MKVSIVVTVFAIAVYAAPRAASDADSTRAASPLGSAPLSQGLLLSSYLSRDRSDNPSPAYLTFYLNPLTIQPYAPASRLDAVMFGAGAAGSVGLFLGALGETLGMFDENTTWILTGALAAGGALYGGTNYEVRATLRPESLSNIPTSDER